MLQKTAITITAILLLVFTNCKKNKRPPLITTFNATNITTSSVVCGGALYAQGDADVTEKGLCWGDFEDPTIDNNKLECGSGEGSFSGTITALASSHNYYARAYAINKYGISYGKSTSFVTSASTLANVATMKPGSVKINTALGGGTVTSVSPLIEKGVCYGTDPYPTIDNYKTLSTSNGINGAFNCNITGLMPGTLYYARAYAINASGVAYGESLEFMTYWGSVTDVDGNTYMTVKIGGQVWMAENLRVSKFRDGTAITKITDAALWSNSTSAAFSVYQNNDTYSTIYGKLYNWYAVDFAGSGKNLAPAGWHIPGDSEWQTLYNACGGDPYSSANALKEKDYTHWSSGGGSDYYRFTALGAGARSSFGSFYNLNQMTGFWSTTNSMATASVFYMDNSFTSFSSYDKKLGFSVRCVKD